MVAASKHLNLDYGNPYLQGNFAPVRKETTIERLKVIGELPRELDGMFVRNGPNPQFSPIRNYHWFEGDGMLHGVRIRDGSASYRNRYIRTSGWKAEHAAGRAIWGSFLDPPGVRMTLRVLSNWLGGLTLIKNTANTALIYHSGKLLALWETGEPHEIRIPDLDTLGSYGFCGQLNHRFTAHPKIDPTTGEMLCFGYDPFRPLISYSIINQQGRLVSTTRIRLRRPIMMHDFAITPRYTIVMDLPFTFSLTRAVRAQSVLRFERELGARFGVLPRYGQSEDVRWFEVPSCYVFHTLNAYEDGEEVVLLGCRTEHFPDGFFSPPVADGGKIIESEWAPVMYRWRIDLKAGRVKEEALDDVASEFPRINERFVGQKMRYGYASTLMTIPNALLKYDCDNNRCEMHSHGPQRVGGEGIFVARPNAKTEDDGWVVTYVHDEATNRSELVVVESQDFGSPPVARIQIPVRVPYGFHGAWISGEALSS